MLLAVDIGNTNINFGIFKGKKLLKSFSIPTGRYSLQKLKAHLGRNKIDESIICSVVPRATNAVASGLSSILKKKPYIIGKNIIVPIRNLYRKPGQVGHDRLVNAYAGVRLYGAPLVMVDFGTAITYDVISRKKEYLGGLILPGLRISLDTLAQRTALLPKVKLGKPAELIGRDTKNSMLSGIVHGFAALTDDLVLRIKHEIGRKARVIGTGGNITLIGRYCRRINRQDKDLTLKGLNMIFNKLSEKKE